MPVDDDLRHRLDRLVAPLEDPAAVVDAVDRRRDELAARRRRGRFLVAASVAILIGAVAVVAWAARDEGTHAPAAVPGTITRVIATEVPAGVELVTVDDWPPPDPELAADRGIDPDARHYTVAYAELGALPSDEPRGFELEVELGVDLDLGRLEEEWGEREGGRTERLTIGGGEAFAWWEDLGEQPFGMHRVWWGLEDLVIRLDIRGFDPDEVLAIARSVRVVDDQGWRTAIASADVAPPHEFLDTTTVHIGDEWTAVAGPYRRMVSPRISCVELRHSVIPADDDQAAFPLLCDEGLVPEDQWAWLEHARAGDTTLLWGLVRSEVSAVQFEYPDGSRAVSMVGATGPISGVPIGEDVWALAGEVSSTRYPERVRFLGADGEELVGTVLWADPDSVPEWGAPHSG